MKSIRNKALISLLLISMSLCITIKRTDKAKSQEETKLFWGDGTFSGGYNCPFMKIKENGSKIKEYGKFFINLSELSSQYGLKFKLLDNQQLDSKLGAFVQKTSTQETFIPWRFFDNLRYEKNFGGYKKFIFDLQNDKQQKRELVFYLPWKAIGNYITLDEALDSITKMTKFRDDQRKEINQAKDTIFIEYQNLVKYKMAQEIRNKKIEEVQSRITEEVISLKTKIHLLHVSLRSKEMQVLKSTSELNMLQTQRNQLNLQLNQAGQSFSRNENLLNSAEKQKLLAQVDNNIRDAKANIETYYKKLDEQCENLNVRPISTFALQGDYTKVEQLLLNVQPSN